MGLRVFQAEAPGNAKARGSKALKRGIEKDSVAHSESGWGWMGGGGLRQGQRGRQVTRFPGPSQPSGSGMARCSVDNGWEGSKRESGETSLEASGSSEMG